MIKNVMVNGVMTQGQKLVISCNIVADIITDIINVDDDVILCISQGKYYLYLSGGINFKYEIYVNDDNTMLIKDVCDIQFADDGIFTVATSSETPTNFKFFKIA